MITAEESDNTKNAPDAPHLDPPAIQTSTVTRKRKRSAQMTNLSAVHVGEPYLLPGYKTRKVKSDSGSSYKPRQEGNNDGDIYKTQRDAQSNFKDMETVHGFSPTVSARKPQKLSSKDYTSICKISRKLSIPAFVSEECLNLYYKNHDRDSSYSTDSTRSVSSESLVDLSKPTTIPNITKDLKNPKTAAFQEFVKFSSEEESESSENSPEEPEFLYVTEEVSGGIITIRDEILGEGSFGKVRLAQLTKRNNWFWRATSQDMAVKVMRPSKMKGGDDVIMEIMMVASLKHPHIVTTHCIYKHHGRLCVLMDLCPKGDLWDFLCDYGSPDEKVCRIWFQQLSSALAYCHHWNIAHRDLKCENVLLDAKFSVKITDFGFACVFRNPANLCIDWCGTKLYMAPEIVKREPYNPMIADIWSLGVTLFCMFHLKLPFSKGKLLQIKNRTCSESELKPNLRPDLSENAKRLILELLEPDVNRRLKISEVLTHPWVGKMMLEEN